MRIYEFYLRVVKTVSIATLRMGTANDEILLLLREDNLGIHIFKQPCIMFFLILYIVINNLKVPNQNDSFLVANATAQFKTTTYETKEFDKNNTLLKRDF
jgi:hypothetical protein